MQLAVARAPLLIGTTILITMTILFQNVYGKPQGIDMFGKVFNTAAGMAGMDGMDGGLPNPDDDDDYEDDKPRLTRSADLQNIEESIIGEESLLAVPFKHELLHRIKRTPCHSVDGTAADDDDADIAERRRRANARKRKAQAKKNDQMGKKTNNNRKRKLVNDDDDANQALTRRRRQTEVDDLNEDETTTENEFAQHVRQFAEKISNIWSGFVDSINEMGEKIKQHFNGQNSTSSMET